MNTEETIMEGHMHEHGLLCTNVPFVMFGEGVWGGMAWSGVF